MSDLHCCRSLTELQLKETSFRPAVSLLLHHWDLHGALRQLCTCESDYAQMHMLRPVSKPTHVPVGSFSQACSAAAEAWQKSEQSHMLCLLTTSHVTGSIMQAKQKGRKKSWQ